MPARTRCETPGCGRMVNPTKHGYTKCRRCKERKSVPRLCATDGCETKARGTEYCCRCRRRMTRKRIRCATPECRKWMNPTKRGYTRCYRCRASKSGKHRRPCANPGCGNTVWANDHCKRCRLAPFKSGLRKPPPRAPRAMCSFEGCKKPVSSLGLCPGHYTQRREKGALRPLQIRGEPRWLRPGNPR